MTEFIRHKIREYIENGDHTRVEKKLARYNIPYENGGEEIMNKLSAKLDEEGETELANKYRGCSKFDWKYKLLLSEVKEENMRNPEPEINLGVINLGGHELKEKGRVRLGIISDTHDRLYLVEEAIDIFLINECDYIFHCGDFTAQETFNEFYNTFYSPKKTENRFFWVTDHLIRNKFIRTDVGHDRNLLFKKYWVVSLDTTLHNKRIYSYHNTYDKDSTVSIYRKISSNEYDFVFYGHLHYLNIKLSHNKRKTVAINPGGFWYPELLTFCILDIDQVNDKKRLELYFFYDSKFEKTLIFDLKDSWNITVVNKDAAKEFANQMCDIKHKYKPERENFSEDENDYWLNKNLDKLPFSNFEGWLKEYEKKRRFPRIIWS